MSRYLPLLCLTCCCAAASAENPYVLLNEGDEAPAFEAVDDGGQLWRSQDHIGRRVVVVYFYPADMTNVCTRQALAYQERLKELHAAGVSVVGVSGDSVKNHQLFKKLNALNFPLLADEDGKVAEAFGVPVRKGGQISRVVDGKQQLLMRGVTMQRWTFVIGINGEIIHKNTDVDPSTEGQSVLKVVRQLTASTQ